MHENILPFFHSMLLLSEYYHALLESCFLFIMHKNTELHTVSNVTETQKIQAESKLPSTFLALLFAMSSLWMNL